MLFPRTEFFTKSRCESLSVYIGIHISDCCVSPWQQFDVKQKQKERSKKKQRREGGKLEKSKKKGNNVRLKKMSECTRSKLEVEVFSEERSDAMMLRGMKHRILDN